MSPAIQAAVQEIVWRCCPDRAGQPEVRATMARILAREFGPVVGALAHVQESMAERGRVNPHTGWFDGYADPAILAAVPVLLARHRFAHEGGARTAPDAPHDFEVPILQVLISEGVTVTPAGASASPSLPASRPSISLLEHVSRGEGL